MRIVEFKYPGVILRSRRNQFTVTYGEILTAERLPQAWRGLRLHVRTRDPILIRCRGRDRNVIEDELRRHGVRIVDEYGAMITPQLDQFEAELARDPIRLQQCARSCTDDP